MRAGLRRRRMSFVLKGRKLKGTYSLVRLKGPKQWLPIKTHAKEWPEANACNPHRFAVR